MPNDAYEEAQKPESEDVAGERSLPKQPWDLELVLTADEKTCEEKLGLVRGLFDRAWEKNNHFDRLRQQHLNYALIAFSGLLAFVINGDDVLLQCIGCIGAALLMAVFGFHDHRLHKYTHGFDEAALRLADALVVLVNNPRCGVKFRLYRSDPLKPADWKGSLHTRVYSLLALAALLLGAILLLREG